MMRTLLTVLLLAEVLLAPREDGGDDAAAINYYLSGYDVRLLPGVYTACSHIVDLPAGRKLTADDGAWFKPCAVAARSELFK